MANLTETSTWEAGIYQIETTDPVLGGSSGIANQQGKQLANRTKYLKDQVDAIIAGTALGAGSIGASKLAKGVLKSPFRNTVMSGFLNNANEPELLQIMGNRLLRFKANNLDYNDVLRLSFASGFSEYGPVDVFESIFANVDVDIDLYVSAASTDIYAFVERDPGTSALTCKVTDKAPVYGQNEPTGATGQYFMNTNLMKMYKWDGSAYVECQAVFIGVATRTLVGSNLDTVRTFPFRQNYEANKTIPIGTVQAFAGQIGSSQATLPHGWLICNGAAISRTQFAELFALIGTTYGTGDGSTTFNLPDLRGEFIRGFDGGRGVDTGRVFGSAQADEFKAHTHLEYSWNAAGSATVGGVGGNFGTAQTGSAGGTETRPRNIAMHYIIKY
jgi:microcystin-dependent protein